MPHDEHVIHEEPQTPSRLTNDDFRKLLMTPRSSSGASSNVHGSVRENSSQAG